MKRIALALAIVLPLGLLAACSSCPCGGGDERAAELVLCDDCGVEKGTDGCCDADAKRCGECGKIEGSPGCCK